MVLGYPNPRAADCCFRTTWSLRLPPFFFFPKTRCSKSSLSTSPWSTIRALMGGSPHATHCCVIHFVYVPTAGWAVCKVLCVCFHIEFGWRKGTGEYDFPLEELFSKKNVQPTARFCAFASAPFRNWVKLTCKRRHSLMKCRAHWYLCKRTVPCILHADNLFQKRSLHPLLGNNLCLGKI